MAPWYSRDREYSPAVRELSLIINVPSCTDREREVGRRGGGKQQCLGFK